MSSTRRDRASEHQDHMYYMPARDTPLLALSLRACGLPSHFRSHRRARGAFPWSEEPAGRARVLDGPWTSKLDLSLQGQRQEGLYTASLIDNDDFKPSLSS